MLIGNAAAQDAFAAAMASRALHHAWLFTGARGIGKASFARIAAMRLLAEAADDCDLPPGFGVPAGSRTRSLMDAGSHPDFRLLHRLPKDPATPDGDLARSITIAQIRGLQPMFATAPSLGARRVVIVDPADDMERGGANALLKNLEEPPAGTIFLLISHAPGRLLPTIRSRCRLLKFSTLSDAQVAEAIRPSLGDASDADVAALVQVAEGSPGRALRYAGLDIAAIDAALQAMIVSGDRDNAIRLSLGKALGGKAAAARYEAFVERAPAVIAHQAAQSSGARLKTALDAYVAARDLAGAAIGLSLDPQGTVIEMAGIVASLQEASPR